MITTAYDLVSHRTRLILTDEINKGETLRYSDYTNDYDWRAIYFKKNCKSDVPKHGQLTVSKKTFDEFRKRGFVL